MKRKSTIEKMVLAAFNNDEELLNKFKSRSLTTVKKQEIEIIHLEHTEEQAQYWLDMADSTAGTMMSTNCLRMAVMIKSRSINR